MFTGARLEELARLRVSDIRTVSGVLVIDIRWREGEPLKTQAAERLVSVHSVLSKLGFAKYVERVRRSGTTSLWPSLRRPKPPRKWGQAFTQWFTRTRRAAGVYRPKLDFHSFRGNFTTTLVNAAVPLERIQALVGHRQQSVTMGVYAKAVDVRLLKKDIEKLNYAGLDLSDLLRQVTARVHKRPSSTTCHRVPPGAPEPRQPPVMAKYGLFEPAFPK